VLTEPQTTRDYMAMYQAAVLTCEILRYQRMKVGVLAAHQRPASESLLRKIKVRPAAKTGISEVAVQSEARGLAAPWFNDPAGHGLAAVSINTTTGTGEDNACADDSCVDAMYQRLRQIEVERVKVLKMCII